MSAQLWGKETLGGLDSGEASARFLGEGATIGVAVVGPDGKILHRASSPFKGSTFYTVPGNPPVPFHDLKQGITPHLDQGLLGGLTVTAAAKPIAKALRSGKLADAQMMLRGLKGDAETLSFRDQLVDRLEKLRQEKKALFEELVKAEKAWDAYKVGTSYLKCFPKATDVAEVKDALKGVQASAAVKSNLAAKAAFAQLAMAGFGTRSKESTRPQTKAALGQMARKYGETEFGKLAELVAK